MILSFKETFPWGKRTHFKDKILACDDLVATETRKLHSIREGQRWKTGMLIHMATGVRTKNYCHFNRNYPQLQRVRSTQRIDIIHRFPKCVIVFIDRKIFYSKIIYFKEGFLRTKEFQPDKFLDFVRNDGFDNERDFWEWFKKPLRNGQIIHWTDLKY